MGMSELMKGGDVAKVREQADAAAQQALQKHPNDPIALEVLRGLTDGKPLPLHQPNAKPSLPCTKESLFNQRKLDEARVQYERAAALDPRYSTAWIYAGDFYFRKTTPRRKTVSVKAWKWNR
jgi:tetratricopeptide (TPR) repeat protein